MFYKSGTFLLIHAIIYISCTFYVIEKSVLPQNAVIVDEFVTFSQVSCILECRSKASEISVFFQDGLCTCFHESNITEFEEDDQNNEDFEDELGDFFQLTNDQNF